MTLHFKTVALVAQYVMPWSADLDLFLQLFSRIYGVTSSSVAPDAITEVSSTTSCTVCSASSVSSTISASEFTSFSAGLVKKQSKLGM